MSITVDPDSTGKVVETATVGGQERVVEVIGDPVTALKAAVLAAAPGAAENGLVVRIAQPSALTDAQLRASAVPVSGTFFQATQPVSGTFWQATQPVSATQLPAALGQGTMAQSMKVVLPSDQSAVPVSGTFWQATQPISGSVTPLEMRAATLHVTNTAAVNNAVTLTLPAAGAGLFHYITHIEVVKLYAVVGVAAAAGVLITSTNLPGNPIWTTEQAAGALGTAPKVISYAPTTPLKSSVANTATTIVCPLQAQTIWRVNVSYFTAV